MTDFDEFCEKFDIVDNAMQMRTLQRWNGRDLREKENLAEHTHLVVSCAIKLYDYLTSKCKNLSYVIDFKSLIRYCMLHDSLELLRGDILSITKDKIPMLREQIDREELMFMQRIAGDCNPTTEEVVKLADLMACYKFIEHELRFPSNDFAIKIYKDVKAKFDEALEKFEKDFDIYVEDKKEVLDYRFSKGYVDDGGTDIILDEDVIFMPMSTSTIGLNVKVTPKTGNIGYLCSRTSAASKGLIVAMCPIDPNFTGEVTAIVHNISNNIIKYKRGQAFCQVVLMPTSDLAGNGINGITVRKTGKRSDGKLGSTGK